MPCHEEFELLTNGHGTGRIDKLLCFFVSTLEKDLMKAQHMFRKLDIKVSSYALNLSIRTTLVSLYTQNYTDS